MAKPLVMVAIRDTGSSEGLVTLGCQMAGILDADLTLMHIVEVPAATPLDAEDEIIDHDGKVILAGAKDLAVKLFSGKVSTDLVRARIAGDAIVAEAKDRGCELLIIGQGSLHTLGEFLVGSTGRHIGRHAPCRVLVQIPPHHHS